MVTVLIFVLAFVATVLVFIPSIWQWQVQRQRQFARVLTWSFYRSINSILFDIWDL